MLYRAAIHKSSIINAAVITLFLLAFYGIPLDPNSGGLLAEGPPPSEQGTTYMILNDENGSSQGQNLAVTGLCVPSPLKRFKRLKNDA